MRMMSSRVTSADDAEQVLHLAVGERRGGLVHDEHVGVEGHGFRDLHHLAARNGQRAHFGLRVDVDRQPLEQGLGALAQPGMVDQAEAVGGLAAYPDVLGHRHAGHQVQLLVDHGDALPERIQRAAQRDGPAPEQDLPRVRWLHARDDLHQRRLAGTVLAHQRMHGAGAYAQLHIVEGDDAGEGLSHATGLQQIAAGGRGGRAAGRPVRQG
jgi:hypothetical protein